MEEKSMVVSVIWVPKGASKKIPKEYDLNDEEVEEIKQEIQNQKEGKSQIDDDEEIMPAFSEATNKKDMEFIESNFDKDFVDIEEFSEEEREDYTIKKSDAVIVGAKIEKGYSCLEVCIYEEQKCNLFQHHEIGLTAFPLCMEWLSINPSTFGDEQAKMGNYAIVGTFLPEIEVWDLDVVNNVTPKICLGGYAQEAIKKKYKNKKTSQLQQKLKEGSHSDAVITLSLNQHRKNILCSGSADRTIKLWDLQTSNCVHTYTHHSDKIQCVKWNNKNETQLASSSFDKRVQIFDARYQNTSVSMKLSNDPESLIWGPFDDNLLMLSLEDGSIIGFDLRNPTENLFNFQAHTKSATSITASSLVPGLMVTTGMDGMIKVWDYQLVQNQEVKIISQRNVAKQAKKLYCGQFYVDSPFLVACGTNVGEIVIWDTSENVQVANHFLNRTPENYKQDLINYLENLKAQSKMEMEEN